MKSILPTPRLSGLILGIWLAVQMSVSLGNILLGGLLAIGIPLLTARFWPDAPEVKNVPLLFKYIFVFLWDVVVANIQVAWWIIIPQSKLKPQFIHIPLDVQHPFTITVLASTISLTPGTISSHISGNRKLLIVHCLHTNDPEGTVRAIKERYEKPLKEIFE